MAEKDIPQEAETIIIGGGIIGCSIAYHLSKRGMKDVVLLERKQLTCGTTWHAAGLVSMLWPTPTLTNLAKYCHELYASLESETGQATGYKRIGSVSLARNEERLEELQRNSSMAKVFGVESRMIQNDELESMYPGIDSDGVIGSLYIEKDGRLFLYKANQSHHQNQSQDTLILIHRFVSFLIQHQRLSPWMNYVVTLLTSPHFLLERRCQFSCIQWPLDTRELAASL